MGGVSARLSEDVGGVSARLSEDVGGVAGVGVGLRSSDGAGVNAGGAPLHEPPPEIGGPKGPVTEEPAGGDGAQEAGPQGDYARFHGGPRARRVEKPEAHIYASSRGAGR